MSIESQEFSEQTKKRTKVTLDAFLIS